MTDRDGMALLAWSYKKQNESLKRIIMEDHNAVKYQHAFLKLLEMEDYLHRFLAAMACPDGLTSRNAALYRLADDVSRALHRNGRMEPPFPEDDA